MDELQKKRLLGTGIKITGCLALNAILPGLGVAAGLLLGAASEDVQEPGAEDPFGIAGLGTNILSTVITGAWAAQREHSEAQANYHLSKAMISALASELEKIDHQAAKSVAKKLAKKQGDPHFAAGFGRAMFGVDLQPSPTSAQVTDSIILGINNPAEAFEKGWDQIHGELKRQESNLDDELLASWKVQIMGGLREAVANFLVTNPQARDKFAFYSNQIQLQISQETLDQVGKAQEELVAIKETLRTLSLQQQGPTTTIDATIKAILQGELTAIDSKINALQVSLSSIARGQALLTEHQFSVTHKHVQARRKELLLCVGRRAEHDKLFDRLKESDKNILLVQAEGGTGKSSFLNAALLHPSMDEYRVAYHFFLNTHSLLRSAREALIHLYSTLLAACGGEPSPGLDMESADVRKVFEGELEKLASQDSRPILLVIDALDEAESKYQDQFDFLKSLPTNVKVIASVRASHHETPTPLPFDAEHYEKVELAQNLCEGDVQEWLTLAGDGELSGQASTLARSLHPATKGLALFVDLIIKDLRVKIKGGQKPQLESDVVSTLEGYIDKQHQRLILDDDAKRWLPALYLLAVAENELRLSDLRDLTTLPHGDPPWSVKRWIRTKSTEEDSGRTEIWWRYDHPRFRDGFLLLPVFGAEAHRFHDHLAKACQERTCLPPTYRLAFGPYHAISHGSKECIDWAKDRLSDYDYLRTSVLEGFLSQRLRDYAQLEKLEMKRKEINHDY